MPSPRATLSGARRTITASAVATVAGALLTTALTSPAGATSPTGAQAVAAPTTAAPDSGKRRIVHYRVRPGDTATELAVRFHAWTAELISLNGLGPAGRMYAGQRIRIPVVVDRAGDGRTGDARAGKKKQQTTQRKSRKKDGKRQAARQQKERKQKARRRRAGAYQCNGCRAAQPAREHVRRVITRTSRRHGVDPELALAISWQESGWRMGPVSYVGAVGAMQVMPTTGVWMSMYAGRRLDINDLHDNAEAGVRMLKVLRGMTNGRRDLVGAYYQGPTAVRKYGLYNETQRYVDNVFAIKRTLERGRPPG